MRIRDPAGHLDAPPRGARSGPSRPPPPAANPQTPRAIGQPAGRNVPLTWVFSGTRRLATAVRRAPLTVCLLVTLWAVGAATHSLGDGPPPGLAVGLGLDGLAEGRWWTVATSLLWCPGLFTYLWVSAGLVGLMAPAEARLGTWSTLVLAVATHVGGVVVGLGLISLGTVVGDPWSTRLAQAGTIGPITVVFGVALAATGRLRVLWRRRLRLVLLVGLVMVAVYSGALPDVLALAAGLVGLAWGAASNRSATRWRASRSEARLFVALVVAASAVGPLIAAVTGTAIGPLSVARFVLLSPMPTWTTLRTVCADPSLAEDCAALGTRLRLTGPGPAFLSVLPVLVLLVLSAGLRRGRRFAWWAALGANVVIAGLAVVLAVLTLASPVERLVAFGGAADAPYATGIVAAVAQPVGVAALLVATRRWFPVRAPRGSYRTWTSIIATALVATSVLYVVGVELLPTQFTPRPQLVDALGDLPSRFLPPGYLGEVETNYTPIGRAATALYEWIGVVFWAVALTATGWLLRGPSVPMGDAAAARALLMRTGGSNMAWSATWSGNSYWFDARGRAAVAYRVLSGVALTTGEPFGEHDAIRPAVNGFTEYCAEHGWIPCFYGVGDEIADASRELGWQTTQVAEETVVALPGLAFTGRRWQDVRTALNRAARTGLTARIVTFTHAPRRITDQIREISEQWVAEKGMPEMGFTVGGLDELADEHVRCLIAVDADTVVHAVTSWMPVYADGSVIGWTLDFMRRREDALPGVTEFLIASAALQFQQEGATILSLSGAPLARLDRGERPDALQRLLDQISRGLEPVYGFRSLLAFKAKFQPDFRPLHLTYPDTTALPAIGTSIARAYLPDLDAAGAVTLIRRLLHRRHGDHETVAGEQR
ncbi:MAG TPA: DUF2156 domain-containing protein [Pseudonocardia sp.]